jgi:hypothetical protein
MIRRALRSANHPMQMVPIIPLLIFRALLLVFAWWMDKRPM